MKLKHKRIIKEHKDVYCGTVDNDFPGFFVNEGKLVHNCLQHEAAGAQAFSSFDTYLAPFVFIDELDQKQVTDIMESFIYSMNQSSRQGESVFSNVSMDLTISEDLKKDIPMCNDEPLFARYQEVLDKGDVENPLFEKATNLAVKAVKRGKSNLLELTYGDFQPEVEKIVIGFYTILNQGDSKNSSMTFPIPTINVTEEFLWDSPMADVIFENAAKMGSSYFQNFLGSQYRINPETGERERDPNALKTSDIRSMCCRLQLDLTQLKKKGGGLFGAGEMTGSIGVVTINLARLGYVYSGDKEGLFKRLDELLNMVKSILTKRRKFCEEMRDRGLYPYTSHYIPSWSQFFSTCGVLGGNEMCINFFKDKNITTATRQGIDFCKEVLNYIRARLIEFQDETGNYWNLEAVPGESAQFRLAKADKLVYPDIISAGSGENTYYTNSTQLPVSFTTDIWEALDLQDELQTLYTGGTVLHYYHISEKPDKEACKKIVKRLLETHRLPYLSLTPTFSVCPKHGRLNGMFKNCPICDQEIIEKYGKEEN